MIDSTGRCARVRVLVSASVWGACGGGGNGSDGGASGGDEYSN